MKNNLKKGVVLLLLLFITSTSIKALTPYNTTWNKQIGTVSNDIINDIIETENNTFIFAGDGLSQSINDFNDGWISKVDSNKNIIWSKQYGSNKTDSLKAIVETSDGGFIAVGSALGDVTNSTNIGNSDGWIVKVDSNGNELMSKLFGTNQTDFFTDITSTNNNQFVISGQVYGRLDGSNTLDVDDGWLMKIDEQLNIIYSKQYGTDKWDGLHSLTTTSNDEIIAAGYTYGKTDDSSIIGDSDSWLLKVDSNGQQIFSKQYGTSNRDKFNAITIDKDGKYIMAGETNGTLSNEINYGATDGMLAKIDTDGTQIFVKQYGTISYDTFKSVTINHNNKIVVAGYTNESYLDHTSSGMIDGLIISINKDGTYHSSKQFGGNDLDYLYTILTTKQGNFITGGYTYGNFIPNAGLKDAWLIKIDDIYQLSLNNNGGIGLEDDIEFIYNQSKTLPINTFTKEGYTFKGWANSLELAGKGVVNYTDTQSYTYSMDADSSLYAVWKPLQDPQPIIKYQIKYFSNKATGKVPIDNKQYELNDNATIMQPTNLTKTNTTFVEWNTQANGKGIGYNVNSKVKMNKNLNLYAQWKTKPITNKNIPKTGSNTITYLIYIITITSLMITSMKYYNSKRL